MLAGPIPARAGQPMCYPTCNSAARAYPRSRGATATELGVTFPATGLSPLARGNRIGGHCGGSLTGPIPARAGQPDGGTFARMPWGAYPRSRGATTLSLPSCHAQGGLSPLARGNREAYEAAKRAWGPIPARAGQPTPARPACCARRAYPRSRGATRLRMKCAPMGRGLSPLARGNRCDRRRDCNGRGPIPARAGQPANGHCPCPA